MKILSEHSLKFYIKKDASDDFRNTIILTNPDTTPTSHQLIQKSNGNNNFQNSISIIFNEEKVAFWVYFTFHISNEVGGYLRCKHIL